jgi:hypothetical protein
VKKVRGRVRQTTTTEAPETTRRSVAVRTRASYNANRNTNRDSVKERGSDNSDEIKVEADLDEANRFLIFAFLSATIPHPRKHSTLQIRHPGKPMVNEIQSKLIPTC